MRSILERTAKRRHALILSLCLNVLIAFIAYWFSTLEFGTNDDRDVSNLLANVNGTPHSHYVTFINVILTKGLFLLYDLTNNFANWYVLVSFAACFCALTAIGYILILRAPKVWIGCGLTMLLLGSLYKSHYIIFQFSQNATLMTMAGCLLLTDSLIYGKEKGTILLQIIGVIFALFGSMLRFSSVYFSFPYLLMFIGYELLFVQKPAGILAWLKSRRFLLIAVMACVLLVASARAIHLYTYSADPMLNEHMEENLIRAELSDYGFPSYEEHAEEMEKLGIHQEDLALFKSHSFLDKSVYTREMMEALIEMKAQSGTSYSVANLRLSNVKDVYEAIKNDLKVDLMWWIIFGCCALYFLAAPRKRWLLVVGTLVIPLVMIWYFVSVQRMPYRVWYSIVAPVIISMTYLCATDSGELKRMVAGPSKNYTLIKISEIAFPVLLIMLMLTTVCSVWARAAEDDTVNVDTAYESILRYAEENPDKLILLDRPSVSPLTYKSTISVTTVLKKNSHRNICYQGGWICWTPANLSVLEHFGVTNVYEAIGNGMEVILIDGISPGMKLRFIRRHYNENVYMEQIGTIGNTNIGIYRFFVFDQPA